ncbi:MAG: 3-carboxy-cis,cis-muconate cycloisomerase, partial [Alphaproteobacteria bacterium]
MSVSPLDSPLMAGALGDAETAAALTDAAALAAMCRFEAALAEAEAEAGVIPAEAARAIAAALAEGPPPPEALAEGAARAGMAVPPLIEALRVRLPAEAAHWLHWGATSQDVIDTALVLRLGPILE